MKEEARCARSRNGVNRNLRPHDLLAKFRPSLVVSLLLLLVSPTSRAAKYTTQPTDSLRISLLTCAAGNEIYALFGHTALRCENLTQGIDHVYNYGVFDFDSPNFAFRFALGETDYLLGRTTFERFVWENLYKGLDVNQLTLDLTQAEKLRLMAQLEENYLPRNRRYRYNYFYDNCATRPRDQVERAVEGRLVYGMSMDSLTTQTFRDIIHQYSEGHPWSRFGMDMCLARPSDMFITPREWMFIPFFTEECFRSAMLVDSTGVMRPLVCAEEQVVYAQPGPNPEAGIITPMQSALLLLLLTMVCTLVEWRRGQTWWGVDVALLVLFGLAGCIVAFMATFSQHPAVNCNYLLMAFHPLHILFLPEVICRLRRGRLSRYFVLAGMVLTLFILLGPLLPQKFNPAVLPLSLCLWTRCLSHVVRTLKSRK